MAGRSGWPRRYSYSVWQFDRSSSARSTISFGRCSSLLNEKAERGESKNTTLPSVCFSIPYNSSCYDEIGAAPSLQRITPVCWRSLGESGARPGELKAAPFSPSSSGSLCNLHGSSEECLHHSRARSLISFLSGSIPYTDKELLA